MSKSQNFLEAEDLTVVYPTGDIALQDVTFTIPGTTFMAIIGPNGSGKSTLLKTMLGLLKPAQGYIKVWGYDARHKSRIIRHMVRYVPQRDHIEHTIPMKVKDIILMGRLLKKPPPRFASERDIAAAKDALHRVALDDLWNQPFPDLSGGQRQRVLVARALASEGRIMMLDEPLLGADHDSQLHIVEALQEYYDQNQVSIIMVTHDLNPIHMMVKDVLMLNRELVGIGQPCDIMDPELVKQVYGPNARIVEMDGHRFCITHDSGVDRHDH